jgi:hypothetical protein
MNIYHFSVFMSTELSFEQLVRQGKELCSGACVASQFTLLLEHLFSLRSTLTHDALDQRAVKHATAKLYIQIGCIAATTNTDLQEGMRRHYTTLTGAAMTEPTIVWVQEHLPTTILSTEEMLLAAAEKFLRAYEFCQTIDQGPKKRALVASIYLAAGLTLCMQLEKKVHHD